MDQKVFEIHDLDKQELPLYFHPDCTGSISNWHENLEFLYCTSGTGLLVCGAVEYTMQPGHIYAINSNEVHGMFDQGQLKYDCLIVDMKFLKQNALHVDQTELKTDIVCPEAAEIIGQIAEEKGAYAAARARGLCLLLMVMLLRDHTRDVSESARFQRSDEPIKQAVAYIHGNYAEKLNLDTLAAQVGFSKYYFARRFKKVTGMTVVEYINLIRCRNAQGLLEQKQCSVQQAAVRCGFENASYFSKTFRAVMGVLPSEVVNKE